MRKRYVIIIICLLVASVFAFNRNSHVPIRVFKRTGEVDLGGSRVFVDTFTLTTGNGFSIDISPAGFSTLPTVQINPLINTSDPMLCPTISVKSISTTAIVVNVTEPSPTTLNILGLGLAVQSPQQRFVNTPSNIKLHVHATGK